MTCIIFSMRAPPPVLMQPLPCFRTGTPPSPLSQVAALQGNPTLGRVWELLQVFAAGRVADFTAFVQSGDNGAWMEGLGVDPVASEATVRLLTLSSLASTAHTLAYDEVAAALAVRASDTAFASPPASDDTYSSFLSHCARVAGKCIET